MVPLLKEEKMKKYVLPTTTLIILVTLLLLVLFHPSFKSKITAFAIKQNYEREILKLKFDKISVSLMEEKNCSLVFELHNSKVRKTKLSFYEFKEKADVKEEKDFLTYSIALENFFGEIPKGNYTLVVKILEKNKEIFNKTTTFSIY